MTKCSVEGCNNEVRARGLCANHWRRWRKYGDTSINFKKRLPKQCSVLNCDKKAASRWKDGEPLCNMHYLRMMKHNSLEERDAYIKDWAVCSVPECNKPARTPGEGKLCEMHYYRLRRTGSLNIIKKNNKQKKHSNGYMIITDIDHPLSNKNGSLYIHRKILFDKISWGPHRCYWCGAIIDWFPGGKTSAGALIVDHLNEKRDDNRLENLVPSCHRCNALRGLAKRWIMDHKEDVLKLIEGVY